MGHIQTVYLRQYAPDHRKIVVVLGGMMLAIERMGLLRKHGGEFPEGKTSGDKSIDTTAKRDSGRWRLAGDWCASFEGCVKTRPDECHQGAWPRRLHQSAVDQ